MTTMSEQLSKLDFKITTEYIINHVKKTFKYGRDIATALKEQKNFDLDTHKPKLL